MGPKYFAPNYFENNESDTNFHSWRRYLNKSVDMANFEEYIRVINIYVGKEKDKLYFCRIFTYKDSSKDFKLVKE